MELSISRLAFDHAHLYLIGSAEGDWSGVHAPGLKAWLVNLGVGDSRVAAVLDMNPDETMSVKVANKAA